MSYSWKTFGSAKTDLQGRLGNTAFWTLTELGVYLVEALQTFNTIAQFYRDRTIFNTQSSFAYYDLTKSTNPSVLVAGTNTSTSGMLGYSITDRNLINSIEYSIVEPITTNWATSWTGTEQFSMDDITRAIERRRNQFLSLVACHITRTQTLFTTPSSTGRLTLSDSIIDIRRVAWKDLTNLYTPLYISDEFEALTLTNNYENSPAKPETFSTILNSPKGIQLIPPPNDLGTVDILSVTNPTNLDPSINVLLNIPDDFTWIIKWGALADLLGKDSQAYDPIRSKYCEQRYEEAVQIALVNSCIYNAAINGSNLVISDLNDFDSYNYNWQNLAGQPTSLAIISRNLIALSPIPNSNEFSIQLDVLRNIPIPINDASFLQISREYYDILLDYAFHLAMFKCQGIEFQGSYPMLNRFMTTAMLNNDKLYAMSKNYDITKTLTQKEEKDRPIVESMSSLTQQQGS